MTTRIFLKKTEALAFERRSFRYDLIDDPWRYPP